jgi:hypothetical protein
MKSRGVSELADALLAVEPDLGRESALELRFGSDHRPQLGGRHESTPSARTLSRSCASSSPASAIFRRWPTARNARARSGGRRSALLGAYVLEQAVVVAPAGRARAQMRGHFGEA